MGPMIPTRPRGSVIIPAHNEMHVIRRTISTLMQDAEPGEFQVVVVCNGCADATADEARSMPFADVAVIEVDRASKPAALNAGDAAARAFPRLYLDADVELTTRGARALLDALITNECVVATPEYLLSGCSPLALAYWKEWRRRNPSPSSGTGCFGLNQAAHESFGQFPSILGDDQFVASMFQPVAARGAITRVRVARTLPAILKRRVRIERGNREVRLTLNRGQAPTKRADQPPGPQREPSGTVGLALILGTHAAARVWSRLRPTGAWAQDVSSRTPRHGH